MLENTVRKAAVDLDAVMRPRSLVIVGMSSKPGTPSAAVLRNLRVNGYEGQIHLVGRSGGVVDGIPCLTSLADLPHGVELAILTVSAGAVRETLEACIERGIKSAVCFASGFAEMGEAGRAQQEELGRIAREGGLSLIGPNCVGYFNYVDSFAVMLVELDRITRLDRGSRPAIAILAQSGGIGAHLAASLQARKVPISYMMTTGNEADLGLADFIRFFADDPHTGAVLVYAEQIRSAQDFLAAVRYASARNTSVALFHPGKSAKAQAATASHTGALAGDYAAMRTIVSSAGVAVADTMEELIDLGQLMLRYPEAKRGGLGVVTGSGAICAIVQDFTEALGLPVPPLSAREAAGLKPLLPDYTPPRNPLDLGTLMVWQPELLQRGIEALLNDENIESVMVSVPYADGATALEWARRIVAAARSSAKPLVYVVHNEDVPIQPDAFELLAEEAIVVFRSPERAMRALGLLSDHAGARLAAAGDQLQGLDDLQVPSVRNGALAEWEGKEVLRAIGVPVAEGRLARDLGEALRIAADIGFPVALKAQSARLLHKSEAGGVLLDIVDEAHLHEQWEALAENIARARPGLELDGVLVEKMGPRGLELVVGARRDPAWGPILLLGLGGVWIEALGDVRLLPADASEERIAAELGRLKAAKLLQGFRGAPPVDVDAVAKAARAIGRLMQARPGITEVDVNPLVVFAKGEGAVALDALIVSEA